MLNLNYSHRKLRKLNFLQERFPRVLLVQAPMLILNKVTPMVVIQ